MVFPNVFINIEMVKLLATHYDSKLKAICRPFGKPFVYISKASICELFKLEGWCNEKIVNEELAKEFWRMNTTYKGWRFPLQRSKQDGKTIPLDDGDGPPFHVDLFEPYMRYTYFSVGQVLGMEIPEYMSIFPMVIATNIQCHNSRLFDYASFVSKELDLALVTIKNKSPILHLRHYFLLMHLVLHFRQELGIWPEKLKVSQFDKEGKLLPIQLWTAIWDSRFANSSFLYFEEYFVKLVYEFYSHPCANSLSDEIKCFLRPKNFNGPIDHNWGDW